MTDNQINNEVTAVTYGTAQTGSFVANKIVNFSVQPTFSFYLQLNSPKKGLQNSPNGS